MLSVVELSMDLLLLQLHHCSHTRRSEECSHESSPGVNAVNSDTCSNKLYNHPHYLIAVQTLFCWLFTVVKTTIVQLYNECYLIWRFLLHKIICTSIWWSSVHTTHRELHIFHSVPISRSLHIWKQQTKTSKYLARSQIGEKLMVNENVLCKLFLSL